MKILFIMSLISQSGAGRCVTDESCKEKFVDQPTNNAKGIDLQSLKVSIPIEIQESDGKTIYFRVRVTDHKNGDTWIVMRRYNQFKELSKELATSDFSDAPFPSADVWFKLFAYTFKDARLLQRIHELEKWIRKAVESVTEKRDSLQASNCGSWPTSNVYGCTMAGSNWEKLSNDSSEVDCRNRCSDQNVTVGSLCCYYSPSEGCLFKEGASVSNDADDTAKAIMCQDTMTARVKDFLMRQRFTSLAGVSLPPDSYATCFQFGFKKVFYHGISFENASNYSYRIMRRYSAFDDLHRDLLGGVGSPLDTKFATEFPLKLGIFSTLTEEDMNYRREGLEIWLQNIMSHKAYECDCWKKRVAEFLNPESLPEERFKSRCKWRKWEL